MSTLPLEQETQHPHPDLIAELSGTSFEELLSGSIVDVSMARVSQAGLFMIAGSWDAAHEIVQGLDTSEARYWHGILHRREPDTSNACYWFRRVPAHPVMTELAHLSTKGRFNSNPLYAELVQDGQWNPERFVRLCQAHREAQLSHHSQEVLQIFQSQECLTLLEFCRNKAVGLS